MSHYFFCKCLELFHISTFRGALFCPYSIYIILSFETREVRWIAMHSKYFYCIKVCQNSYLLAVYFLTVRYLKQKTKKWACCIRINWNVLDSKRQCILILVNLSLITIYDLVFPFASYMHAMYVQNVAGSKVSYKDGSAASGKQTKGALKRTRSSISTNWGKPTSGENTAISLQLLRR